MKPPGKLTISFCSDIFLHDRRLRSALALLYDKIYLPELPTSGSGCQNVNWDGVDPSQVIVSMKTSDGALGCDAIIERVAPSESDKVFFPEMLLLIREARRLRQGGHPDRKYIDSLVPGYGVDEQFLVFFAVMGDKIQDSLRKAGFHPGIFYSYCLANFFWHAWSEAIAPRFFVDNKIFHVPLALEDMAVLLQEQLLNYFIPEVGSLEDDDILLLRQRTASERLGYLAHIFELVGECDMARNTCALAEVRRMLSEKIKLKIVPAFVEYANSLRAEKKAKSVKCLDHLVTAFSVSGGIWEPRYWLSAAKSLLGGAADEAGKGIEEMSNRRQFMSYLLKLVEPVHEN